MQPLYLIELNEINFEFVKYYIDRGQLPCFAHLIAKHGVGTTVSETVYDHIEPWIQWVTAHTGKTLDEHGVFRLGDIVDRDIEQIWERLERRGLAVGAVSPMNASNRLKKPSFFVPDPWTPSTVSADGATQALYRAVRQAVGDNAGGRITMGSLFGLCRGFITHVPVSRWSTYARLVLRARGRSWVKAIVLDELLADLFMSLASSRKPAFASLFLNAGAHIQHHYLFNSAAYKGGRTNPAWYVGAGEDPVLEIYQAYDRFLSRLLERFSDARVLLATGLHQDPYPVECFYWRLRDHKSFLDWAGCDYVSVEPLMSRDFVVRCKDAQQAVSTAEILTSARIDTETSPVFTVDNRGDSVFCTLVYEHDIPAEKEVIANGRRRAFRGAIEFVAIKNAHHNGIGYLLDTGSFKANEQVPLGNLFTWVEEHFQAGRVA